MDMDELGYFIYMNECENEKVNVEIDDDFIGDEATPDEDEE